MRLLSTSNQVHPTEAKYRAIFFIYRTRVRAFFTDEMQTSVILRAGRTPWEVTSAMLDQLDLSLASLRFPMLPRNGQIVVFII